MMRQSVQEQSTEPRSFGTIRVCRIAQRLSLYMLRKRGLACLSELLTVNALSVAYLRCQGPVGYVTPVWILLSLRLTRPRRLRTSACAGADAMLRRRAICSVWRLAIALLRRYSLGSRCDPGRADRQAGCHRAIGRLRAQWLVKSCCMRSKLLEDTLVWLLEARGCIAYPISPLYAAGHPLHHIERHYFRPAGYWMVFSAGCFVVAGVLSAFIGPSFLFSTCKSFDSAPSNLWTVRNLNCTSPF